HHVSPPPPLLSPPTPSLLSSPPPATPPPRPLLSPPTPNLLSPPLPSHHLSPPPPPTFLLSPPTPNYPATSNGSDNQTSKERDAICLKLFLGAVGTWSILTAILNLGTTILDQKLERLRHEAKVAKEAAAFAAAVASGIPA
ncbi:hypothetical protein A2U01_0055728, partial [Trifolium medium]|nr:hypothetical protein [Trifolium medium]